MEQTIEGPQAHYFKGLASGVFEIQHCRDCGMNQFFPRVLCHHCGGTSLEWMLPSGAGVIYSYSIVRRKLESGGDYNVVLVDLEEGVRVMSSVQGIEQNRIFIGMPVRAYVEVNEGAGTLYFKMEESA